MLINEEVRFLEPFSAFSLDFDYVDSIEPYQKFNEEVFKMSL